MDASGLHFIAIVGSLRRTSYARSIAETLDELAPEDVAVTVLPSIENLPLYSSDIHDPEFPKGVASLGREVGQADAVVIVTPEYNYSFPGGLKNALDWLGRLPHQPFEGKPVALQTASVGLFGGCRAQHHLRQVLLSLDAQVLNKPEVAIPLVAGKVDLETSTLREETARLQVAAQLLALRDLARRSRLSAS